MKNLVINILLIGLVSNIFFADSAIAQISREGTPTSEIYSNLETINSLPIIIMEEFDIDKLIEEDKLPENRINKPVRFAKAFDVYIDVKEKGLLEILPNNDKLWRLRIKSPGAYSLNLTFGEYVLPVGAKVFIYNKSKTHTVGAFTEENNKQSKILAIQPVEGDEIIIEYYEPSEISNPGTLIISRVGHDYKGAIKRLNQYDGRYGLSQWCNVDINCPAGDDWQTGKWSVCRIYVNNTYWCSGSLINNTNNDYKSYFLTAHHCIETEYVANNSVFVFNYESPSCNGPDGYVSQTVSGANLRATWEEYKTDFTLLELSSMPPISYYPVWNGWDRRTITPVAPVACIHHPMGDVKKISIDNTSPSSLTYYWRVTDWNIGTVEHGSSGAPFYNSDHRVVGQVSGGNEILCSPNELSYYGKLSKSWNGGGSSSSRLRNWLDPSSTGKYVLDNIRRQYITGPAFVCNTNSTFTLHNVPIGDGVTWSVSPGYFVSPSSGTGSTATFYSVCNYFGNATITFTISGSRGPVVVSKDFISGGPDYRDVEFNVTYSTGESAPYSAIFLLCPYTYYYFYVITNSSCSTSGYEWTLPPSISLVYQYNNMACVYTGYNPGGIVSVKATTCCSGCGKLKIFTGYVGTYWDCGGYYFSMSPNPADDYVEITAEKDQHESTQELVYEEYEVSIYNSMKVLLYQTKTKELQFRIDTRQFKSGVYFVHFIAGDDTKVLQLIVSH